MPTPPAWLIAGDRPVLMAIGDSFLNGMRSLTIDDSLARLSIPAEVGRALDAPDGFAPFVPAAYPRPVLIDAEATLRRHVSLGGLAGLVQLGLALDDIRDAGRDNARAWVFERAAAAQPAVPRRFDNLAIAGARLPDVFGCTYGQVAARWDAMRTEIIAEDDPFAWSGTLLAGDPYGDDRAYADQPVPTDPLEEIDTGWSVADCHIALNALHLMNPDAAPGLDDLRVIDIVHARRPLVLLVNLAANHGLPDICMAGEAPRGAARLRRFARLWPRCAVELAATPDLGLAVILLPPLPSQVPALMYARRDDGADPPRPPEGPDGRRYHDAYVSAMSFVPPARFYTADEVRGFDAAAEQARQALRRSTEAAFRAAGKAVAFVDLAALVGQFDVKNGMGPPFVPDPATGIGYDNRSLADRGVLAGRHRLRGGICSLDNFHPSTLGYRYVARAVVEAIAAVEPELVRALPTVSIAGDSLLSDIPWPAVNMLQVFWPFAQALPGGAALAADLAAAPNARGARAMNAILRFGGLR
jgi:hypothetical protein